jgi:serine/threonine protein kinase/tetratricopeptide (TPR) repeat protein
MCVGDEDVSVPSVWDWRTDGWSVHLGTRNAPLRRDRCRSDIKYRRVISDQLDRLNTALVGRYRASREVGAGGMATVYLAEDLKHHRQVAIKVLRPELAASLGAERFLREIEIAAGLHHPHILPLYDSGDADGALFYVMPFVDGQSLRDRLDKVGAMPIDESVRLLREITDAIAYSHQHGVVHRDIKPENILLSGAHALVTDFGIAKALSDAAGVATLTSTGMSVGTPAYMAPEQATASPGLDHRVDIYALGVVAYEMLAGRAPFLGTNPQQIIAGHLTRTPDALSSHRNTVPAALEAIVMRCLEKNPGDRWQSADELLRALEPTAAAPRGRKRMLAGATVAVVLAAVGIAWFGKVGRAGTLIGNNVLAANDLVLVSDFQNRASDSTLAPTITDAVRVELQQSRVVRVMTQSEMWAGLKRMGVDHGAALPDAKVKELAEREGAKAYIVGDIAKLGGGYSLTARVVATAGGSEALTARATAADESKLIGAVEELGRALRRGIGESLRSLNAAPPLAQVTTASLPALRSYTAALRSEANGERDRAILLAKEALASDSTFAGAWDALYVFYSNNNLTQAAAEAEMKAYALRDRLTEREQLRVTARYHGIRGEFAAEEAAWSRLAEMGYDETNYANMLLEQQRFAEAEVMGRHVITMEPRQPIGYWNLAEAQIALGKFAAADSTIARFADRIPESALRRTIVLFVRYAKRDLDGVEQFLSSPSAQGLATPRANCIVDWWRGRLRKLGPACNGGAGQSVRALGEFRLTGDTTLAHAGYAPFLATTSTARGLDDYGANIALLAEVGHVREAKSMYEEWRARSNVFDQSLRAESSYAVGAIAAAEGQWDRAATAFLAYNAAPMPTAVHVYSRGLPEAANAMDRLGKSDSAIVLYERAFSSRSMTGGRLEATWYGPALQKLGDLYDAKGDRAKAAGNYMKFVQLYRDADPEIAAQVRNVKAKLAKLSEKDR